MPVVIKASDAVGDMSDEVLIRFLRGRVCRRDEAAMNFALSMIAHNSPDIPVTLRQQQEIRPLSALATATTLRPGRPAANALQE